MRPSIPRPALRRPAVAVAVLSLALAACSSIDTPAGQSAATTAGNQTAKNGGTLVVALSDEPDALDPTTARTLVGRAVFTSICEKLYDINAKLDIIPQLAASMPETSADGKTVTIKLKTGVKFADGTAMDGAAVKTSLDRDLTLATSARKSDLASVQEVTVTDPGTVVLHLKSPFAPLVAQLADRAGMVMSPAALKSEGEDFGAKPVCVGPFKFQSRVAQDHIDVVKDPNYYDAANVKLDKVSYKIIADSTTRFNNLRSGDVQVLDAVAPTDVDSLQADSTLSLLTSDSLGYQGITVNIGNVNGVGKPAATLPAKLASTMATDPRVRQAFELSLDRDAINKVVFQGKFAPACGPISPDSPFSSDAAQVCTKHDPAAAKALLQQAGVQTPLRISMIVANTPDATRLGQAIQAQVKDGGFDLRLVPTEFASSLDQTDAGDYQMFQIGWSGRVDPDGNISNFVSSEGSQNNNGYSNSTVDTLIGQSQAKSDPAERAQLFGQVVTQLHKDLPIIYLYRLKNFTGVSKTVVGVQMYGDGLMRFAHAGFAG
ncbi:MAG TPA: ABC transporter substrate-binding protein [Mycobacteriales bacterium]|jgi:peptide/nickel transport system substrate-binding protein|nr:ABC transporter substrate-binding protein [Mycobacteriales bacterium]